jgi:L-serine dehydratase
MEFISILNDVLGPVMRGPSSSHTAGSHHIGRLVRSLLGEEPARAVFTFDPDGSYAATYRQQGVDLALASALLGWPITDKRFARALALAPKLGLRLEFKVAPLERPEHPNTVAIEVVGRSGRALRATARSIGGGMIEIIKVDGQPVRLDGKGAVTVNTGSLARTAEPIFFVRRGTPLFNSASEMVRLAGRRRIPLGRLALIYEAKLLGLPEAEVLAEIGRRYDIMRDSVRRGLSGRGIAMKLLGPTAGKILRPESERSLPAGGYHTRAAARAMAALHISNSGGIVCAAPTGGSAGVLPGVLVTLAEEGRIGPERTALALLAAGAVGVIVARRATFAAEVAGCQVEIGAAGAMAAAAVVDAAGGSAAQAADAAAIALQNTMGSVCDLVQGLCEIPCHTRNAAAASNAFLCADLVTGGYRNPVPLDETIDASFDAGRMLPSELRCTAKGGLAVTPSALALGKRKAMRSR